MTSSLSLEVLFYHILHVEDAGQAKKLYSFKQLHLAPDDYYEKRWLETVALSYLQFLQKYSLSVIIHGFYS